MVIRKGGALLLVAILLIAGIFGAAKAMRYFYQKAYPLGYEQLVLSACEENELEPSFVFAVIRTESAFGQMHNPVLAHGIVQITEETFQWIQFRMKDESGVSYDDLFDEKINIQYGTFLLKTLLDEFGSEANALCAYHAGWGNAKKWLQSGEYAPDGENIQNIPFGDTSRYVEKVIETQNTYEKLYDFSVEQ